MDTIGPSYLQVPYPWIKKQIPETSKKAQFEFAACQHCAESIQTK
jgi:hypothetical protein